MRKLSSSLMAMTSSYRSGSHAVGEEVLADALDEVRPSRAAGEHRALGVGGDDLDRRVLRLQVAGDAGDRAARARAGDEVGDPPGRLAPDLGPGGLLVGQRVGRVGVLVGAEGVELVGQPVGDRVVALRVLGRHGDRAHHDLGAVGPQQRDLLRGHLVGHHEDAAVAALGGDDGEADAGVAARRLDDRAARPQQAVALGGEDHLQRRPVLRRAARVRRLHLHRQHAGERSSSLTASCAPAACCRSGRAPSRRSRCPRAGDRQPCRAQGRVGGLARPPTADRRGTRDRAQRHRRPGGGLVVVADQQADDARRSSRSRRHGHHGRHPREQRRRRRRGDEEGEHEQVADRRERRHDRQGQQDEQADVASRG